MGFPTWTLIGMGVTAVLALLMTGLAYLAQSPRAMLRLGLVGYRLDLRVKLFTGYALASLILMLGFFLAGVPLEDAPANTAVSTPLSDNTAGATDLSESAPISPPGTAVATSSSQTNSGATDDVGIQTPSSGAFGGPPPGGSEEIATETAVASATPAAAGPSPTPGDRAPSGEATSQPAAATVTPTMTASPAPTATPLPTATPTPTMTPTPIEGETAIIDTGGSTLWVRRSPGGQQLVLVQDGEIVLLENGRANQGGILWREIRTTSGILGWVQMEFLEEGP